MRFTALAGLALLAASSAGFAQCPTSVTATRYGQTCDYFGQPSVLTATYDASSCSLTFDLTSAATCCNTYPWARFLMLGNASIVPGIAHPLLVPGCLLSVQPTIVLPQMSGQPASWTFQLPPLPPLTIYGQGLVDYFTTIGFTHDYQTSQGLQVDIR